MITALKIKINHKLELAIKFLVLALLFADLGYSFTQHANVFIDGDVPAVVMPAERFEKVLTDPFGFSVIKDGETYGGSNRYFAHAGMYYYFRSMPFLLQNFTDPVNSIYLSAAIIKTLIQALLIYFMAVLISNSYNLLNKKFLFGAAVVTPFFQAFGYFRQFAIIDVCITYAMFYGLAFLLIILFFLPYFRKYYYGTEVKFNSLKIILLGVLAIVIAFHGPVNFAVVLLVGGSLGVFILYKNIQASISNGGSIIEGVRRVVKLPEFWLIVFICILSLYSFYIGRSNTENSVTTVSIAKRYSLMLTGLGNISKHLFGALVFIPLGLFNFIQILFLKSSEDRTKLIKMYKWMWILTAVYIILLPFGGYRAYRPNIVRGDILMPAYLALIVFYGMSGYFLIKQLKRLRRNIVAVMVFVVIAWFTIGDKGGFLRDNYQRKALYDLAASNESLVKLDANCTIMAWIVIKNPNDSKIRCELLKFWGVIKDDKLFYQKK